MKMPIAHTEHPLQFSDQPGYTLVCLASQKSGDLLALDVEVTERVGWWQTGWLASLFHGSPAIRRSFVGCYVWYETPATGGLSSVRMQLFGKTRVPFNLEHALIELRRKIERAG